VAVSDDIKQALYDAIGWQESLADATRHCDDGSHEEALAQAAKYRKILQRRYGQSSTPLERMLDSAETMSIYDLMERGRDKPK
jgi:hypothetical protein